LVSKGHFIGGGSSTHKKPIFPTCGGGESKGWGREKKISIDDKGPRRRLKFAVPTCSRRGGNAGGNLREEMTSRGGIA